MIKFLECQKEGYAARTEENVINSDCTIAIAKDFNSAGERLTKRLCEKYNKDYFPLSYKFSFNDMDYIVAELKEKKKNLIINVAGNGIYSLDIDQSQANQLLAILLNHLTSNLDYSISIRSGGQTGMDEAAVVSADRLEIPATVLAPKGWMFRNKNHRDIKDKSQFLKRFGL